MKLENKVRVLDKISPQMREVLNIQAERPQPAAVGEDYSSQRRAYQEERQFWNQGGPQRGRREDNRVPTPYGEILTRLYTPFRHTPATLFYLHGGGFILGNLETHDRIMRLLAKYSGCTVIGVDYTLSPEAKFPQAIKEIVAVCEFYDEHAERFGLNMNSIGLAGDSAGAMLALASSLWLRDNQLLCGKIKGLLLWYGLYGLQDSVSRRLFGGAWDGLSQKELATYESAYLGKKGDRESPYYCLFNNDLSHDVPPCFIATAEFDPLIDDSLALCHILLEHGLHCHYQLYPGTLHAFLHYSRFLESADDALRDGARYFRQQLKAGSALLRKI